MATIRVIIADHHALCRAGIRNLLQGLEGVEVVAEAGHGGEALPLVEAHRPDVLLTEIAMPHLSGLELARRVTRERSPTRVIILSTYASEDTVSRALQAGASGYLTKDSGPAELELAVRAVARGDTYLSPSVSTHMIAGYLKGSGRAGPGPGPLTRARARSCSSSPRARRPRGSPAGWGSASRRSKGTGPS